MEARRRGVSPPAGRSASGAAALDRTDASDRGGGGSAAAAPFVSDRDPIPTVFIFE